MVLCIPLPPSVMWPRPTVSAQRQCIIDAAHLNSDLSTHRLTASCCYSCPGCLEFMIMIIILLFYSLSIGERERIYKDVLASCGGPRTVFSSQFFSFIVRSGEQIQVTRLVWQAFYPLRRLAQPCFDFFVFSGITQTYA